MSIFYPALFEAKTDDVCGAYDVSFRDIPEAKAEGNNLLDAIHKASDCLKEAMEGYIERGEPLPIPSDRLDTELNIVAKR